MGRRDRLQAGLLDVFAAAEAPRALAQCDRMENMPRRTPDCRQNANRGRDRQVLLERAAHHIAQDCV